jgi:hypothetical protein
MNEVKKILESVAQNLGLPASVLSEDYPSSSDPEVCTSESGKGYYVTAVDGPRCWRLAGPYDTHAEALAAVDRVREICVKSEPWSHFYAFGTAKIASRKLGSVTKAGLLGVILGAQT